MDGSGTGRDVGVTKVWCETLLPTLVVQTSRPTFHDPQVGRRVRTDREGGAVETFLRLSDSLSLSLWSGRDARTPSSPGNPEEEDGDGGWNTLQG